MVKSPLPFGIHRLPDVWRKGGIFLEATSLHCLSAFTVFLTSDPLRQSDHGAASPLPFGIHRLPDKGVSRWISTISRSLHCLSAFTVFLTLFWLKDKPKQRFLSPLPFGIHRLPDSGILTRCMRTRQAVSGSGAPDSPGTNPAPTTLQNRLNMCNQLFISRLRRKLRPPSITSLNAPNLAAGMATANIGHKPPPERTSKCS